MCKHFFYFYIFSFLFLFTILSYTLILPVSQFQTQKLMTSQIRSHTEYLRQTYNIVLLILHSKLVKNIASMTVFKYDLTMMIVSGLLFWATL